jgi:hypothetical protein
MEVMRRAMAIVALVVAAGLISGGLLHAGISHEHGHSHGGHTHAEESPQWGVLHDAVRHEDEKDLLLLLAIALGAAVRVLRLLLVPLGVPVPPDKQFLLEELRRGIAPYRKFG